MDARQSARDQALETFLGHLLRTGVSIAAAVVAAGAIWYLLRHGQETPQFQAFEPSPANQASLADVLKGIGQSHARSLIQAGLVLLIATPIARVISALAIFAAQRDIRYVIICLIVLTALAVSLLGP